VQVWRLVLDTAQIDQVDKLLGNLRDAHRELCTTW